MGASHLQTLDKDLPAKMRKQVEVEYKRCLGLCNNNDPAKAPFVIIDGKVISDATVYRIIESVTLMQEEENRTEGGKAHDI